MKAKKGKLLLEQLVLGRIPGKCRDNLAEARKEGCHSVCATELISDGCVPGRHAWMR